MLQLLKKYENQPVNGWLMSEKFDGVRCYWNGFQFMTREHNIIKVPAYFYEQMPSCWLDGELWAGRGKLNAAVNSIRNKKYNNWNILKFMVFDLPMNKQLFLHRVEKLNNLELPKHCEVVQQTRINNKKHLMNFHKEVLNNGGEGVVIKSPTNIYYPGRTNQALKLKQEESIEIQVTKLKRDNDFMINGVECDFQTKLFNISAGLEKLSINNSLKIGDIITIKHQGFTSRGLPRHPVYLETRNYE